MENCEDLCNIGGDGDGDGRATYGSACSLSSTSSALIVRQSNLQGLARGDNAAEVILWRQRCALFGLVVVATAAWMLFERSGLPFISACCDVLLILVVMLFLRANYAAYRKKRLPTLPELVLTEEMVNNAAASFRAKINYVLLMAHDITLGRDFKLFFKAVIFLWILSVIGSVVSFFTIAYVGTIIFIIVPALYNRFEGHLDGGHFSRQYKVVDESIRRLPRNLTKDKDL
nr:reticulon-like protein B16 [Ipomoea batatas]